MAETVLHYVTDNDHHLQCRRQLGSGGYGSVYEVCSLYFIEADEDL
jgi:hypothetical protein